MVGRGLQMFASMPEVDHLGFGRQGLQEGPVVGGAIGDSDDPDLGARSPDVCDFACELRLQRELAALRHATEIEGLHALAVGVVEGDRAAGGLAPGGLGATVLAGSQRHHDAVEGDRGGGRVLRYALGLTDAAQRFRAEALPAFVHAQGQALQGAHRRRHGAGLRKERRRFPGPCSDPSSADRARPPDASGNRRRGPGSRRPAPAMPRSRRCGNALAGTRGIVRAITRLSICRPSPGSCRPTPMLATGGSTSTADRRDPSPRRSAGPTAGASSTSLPTSRRTRGAASARRRSHRWRWRP